MTAARPVPRVDPTSCRWAFGITRARWPTPTSCRPTFGGALDRRVARATVDEPTELTDDEAATYGREVLIVGRALETTFSAVKMNYNTLGNWVPHLHTHVVPRYADDPRPGWPFPFPEPDQADATGDAWHETSHCSAPR